MIMKMEIFPKNLDQMYKRLFFSTLLWIMNLNQFLLTDYTKFHYLNFDLHMAKNLAFNCAKLEFLENSPICKVQGITLPHVFWQNRDVKRRK